MTLPVLVAPAAAEQIVEIDAWWRENRPASPDLFEQELAQAFATIADAPSAGTRYPHAEIKDVRRLHLRTTRNHVYYVGGRDGVVIVAVWGAIKGAGPDLAVPGR